VNCALINVERFKGYYAVAAFTATRCSKAQLGGPECGFSLKFVEGTSLPASLSADHSSEHINFLLLAICLILMYRDLLAFPRRDRSCDRNDAVDG
jgi:hypothetical protein